MRQGKMSLFTCVALIIGACIGSAIFSISGVTILYAGSSAVLSWIIAAAIYLGYGIVVTALAVRYPYSGGIYVFPKLVFGSSVGSFWGYISACGYVVSNTIAIGFSAIYFGVYLQDGFPALGSGPWPAILSCILSALVTIAGGKHFNRVQNTLVVLLLSCLSVYCAFALFGGGFDVSPFSSENFFSSGVRGRTGFISAVPLALVAYGGCIVVAFMASEVRSPGRNIPLSLLLGLCVVCAVYVLLIVGVVGTLPLENLKGGGDSCYIPLLASVSQGPLLRYPFLKGLLSVSGAVAFLTTMIALMAVNMKAIRAMVTPRQDKASMPVLVFVLACMALCLLKEWTMELISLGAILNIVSMSITCFCLVKVGKKALPLATIGVFLLCSVSDIMAGGGRIWVFTAAIYAVALSVYLFLRNKGKNYVLAVRGIVVHGKGHGHLHGMPTANLELLQDGGITLPHEGVWKTRTKIDGFTYASVTNVGLRPTDDDDKTPTIETYIIDFDKDIYGKEITVFFEEYIRPTRKFDSLDELRAQIEKDIAACS